MLISLTSAAMHVSVMSGNDPVRFSVRGMGFEVALGKDVTVELADQGRVLAGAPTLRSNHRRDDGTLMVPVHPTLTEPITTITGSTPAIG